jgi:hypothetical protein
MGPLPLFVYVRMNEPVGTLVGVQQLSSAAPQLITPAPAVQLAPTLAAHVPPEHSAEVPKHSTAFPHCPFG